VGVLFKPPTCEDIGGSHRKVNIYEVSDGGPRFTGAAAVL
jgi:hypothetical protein